MATVLERRLTINDRESDIQSAILKLALDKNRRVMFDDDIEWLQTKMKEIARLTRLLQKKFKSEIERKARR